MASGEVTDRLRSLWERYAPRYDRDTGFYDLLLAIGVRLWRDAGRASRRCLQSDRKRSASRPLRGPSRPDRRL